MAINLLRDAKVFLSLVNTGFTTENTFEVKVLDGFSFSQNTSTQEVTLNEAGAAPNRGQKIFNTALDPVDFSFSTYVRPYILSGVATPGYQPVGFGGLLDFSDDSGLTAATTYDFLLNIDTAGAALVVITTGTGTITVGDVIQLVNDQLTGATLDFEKGDLKIVSETTGAASSIAITDDISGDPYLFSAMNDFVSVDSAVAGSASSTVHTAPEKILWDGITNNGAQNTPTSMDINFDQSNAHELLKFFLYIDLGDIQFELGEAIVGSAEIDFSIDGIGTITWTGQASTMNSGATVPTTFLAVPPTAGFLKNKLSTVEFSGGPADTTYTLGLTSATITIDNGVTFLIPEELGIVNTPIGHFTGTRAISGTMTTYLDSDANKSLTLLADMLANTDVVTNEFAMVLNMGGVTVPYVAFEMPKTHIVIPQVDSQDVISLTIDFTALGTGLTTTDEMTVSYYAKP